MTKRTMCLKYSKKENFKIFHFADRFLDFVYIVLCRPVIKYVKDNTSAQQYSFITINMSNRQHVSTNQVVIIRSITEIYRITEGCAHIWDLCDGPDDDHLIG